MIGQAIQAKARELDMTGYEACEFLGITYPTWLRWVSGETTPKPRFSDVIARLLALENWQGSRAARRKAKTEKKGLKGNIGRPADPAARERRIERAESMAALYREGKTLEDIAKLHGITRERVRQLLKCVGVSRHEGGASVRGKQSRAARVDRLNQACIARYGIPRDDYRAIPPKARQAFREQKRNARVRGIEWQMTIGEWWDVWQKSGKWPQRGRGQGYCMGRKGDCGPYSVDNVYICAIGQNFSDSYIWKPAHMRKPKSRNGAPPKMYEYQGRRLTISQWAQIVGIPSGTLSERMRRGMAIDEALVRPIKKTGAHLKRLAREAAA